MKLSELIRELQSILDDEGDLDVHSWPYDGQGSLYSPDLQLTDLPDKRALLIDGR